MTQQEIISTINSALAEEFELEPEDMKAEAHIYKDLGLDSLDAVDMVIILEKAFGCKLRDEKAIQTIQTLGDLYSFIENKQKESG